MNRLVLIDGNAILHRAFHAIPPLTSPDGSIVNAVYGFTSIVIRLIHDLNPSFLAVSFDRAAPTFRKKIFKDYQIKRPKMDDTLIPQIEKVHEVVRAFNIPIFEMDGFEADDVIGTIVHSIKSQKKNGKSDIEQIIIVTGDRDILQLVEDEQVMVYMPTKGLSEGKLYGEKETEERLGVAPKLIPDYKALAGDASDNYPGIPGIGPKIAVEILKKAGSVDALFKNIEHTNFGLSDSLIVKIKEGKESALLSYRLATIMQDVPIEVVISEFFTAQLISDTAAATLRSFGFTSLLKRLEKGEDSKKDNEIQKQKADKKEKESEQLALV